MAVRPLGESIFDPDVRRINFFNGRLLSGEDLTHEQGANEQVARRLGRATGEGIAYGLEVVPTPGSDRVRQPTLSVAAGLAVSRRGDTLQLADPVEISLKELPRVDAAGSPITTFSVCEPPAGSVYVAGAGLYLLTIGAVEGREGRAPVSGLGNVEASCNTKYLVPGVRFRLISIDLRPGDLDEPDRLRNRLAYRCLVGDPPVEEPFWANPFGPPVGDYGLIDELRPGRLQRCEVPLALVYLTATGGLVFVDAWSVRRRLTAPDADARFRTLTGDRRAAEGEAMVSQFQSQVEDALMTGAATPAVAARDWFAYLPPFGLLPLASGALGRGFDYATFFGGMTFRRPIFVEGAQLRPLAREALDYPPIDTASPVVVWLYIVREGAQAGLASSQPPQSYLVFASGHTAYRGEARYDVHRWNFGNFS
jgi:hypothetical protein